MLVDHTPYIFFKNFPQGKNIPIFEIQKQLKEFTFLRSDFSVSI